MPSIKLLGVSLELLCVCATAFMCTFLAISSSEEALEDTKDSRDESVAFAFSVGSEGIKNRTIEHFNMVMQATVALLNQSMREPRLLSLGISQELTVETWDTIRHWGWHHLPRYFHGYNLLRERGCTGVTIILKNRLTILMYEEWYTVDGHDILRGVLNYGSDHPHGGLNLTFEGTLNRSTGDIQGVENPLEDVYWNHTEEHPCDWRANTHPEEADQPCGSRSFADPLTHIFTACRYVRTPIWSSPIPVEDFLMVNFFSPVYHGGEYTGCVLTGLDLRHVSRHLSGMLIGGLVSSEDSRGRIFITTKSSWMDPTQAGRLIGASHGDTVVVKNGVLTSLYPNEVEDQIISGVANTTVTMGVVPEEVAENDVEVVMWIETESAPTGEEFYYRARGMVDYGLDWLVHVVVDRKYVLGTIDEMIMETRSEIEKSEEDIDKSLRDAQLVMFVLISAVAVALLLLAALLGMKVVRPIVALERDMEAVATMRLEEVDMQRALSSLSEVRRMQISFLQMTTCLVEYRNFMPASVLHEDVPEDNDGKTLATNTDPTLHSATLTTIDLNPKRVTLMVCNIVGFLHTRADLQPILTHYLSSGLQYLKETKGISDGFSGDRLYASWNAIRSCGSHRLAAHTCAQLLCSDESIGMKLSVGLAAGSVTCGNMGCEGMKKYSFLGSLSSWVHVVERVGKTMGCDIAIDAVVKEEVGSRVYTRIAQHVLYGKHSDKVLLVYEALNGKSVAEEEWMYQLEEGDRNDPNKAYNSSYILFMRGMVEEAVEQLGDPVDDDSEVMAAYKERLATAIKNPKACSPLGALHSLLL